MCVCLFGLFFLPSLPKTGWERSLGVIWACGQLLVPQGDGTFLSTLLQPGVMRRVNPVRIVWVLLYLEYSEVDACGGAGEGWREGRTEEALAALIVDGGREIFLAP